MYLDVENQPTAFTFDKENVTFLFKDTKGMYYQFFVLLNGKHTSNGSKSKIEAISIKNIPNSRGKRKNSSLVYTQIRKTIYITKIASVY